MNNKVLFLVMLTAIVILWVSVLVLVNRGMRYVIHEQPCEIFVDDYYRIHGVYRCEDDGMGYTVRCSCDPY